MDKEELRAICEDNKFDPEQIGIKLLRLLGYRIIEYVEGGLYVYYGESLLYWK